MMAPLSMTLPIDSNPLEKLRPSTAVGTLKEKVNEEVPPVEAWGISTYNGFSQGALVLGSKVSV